MRTTVLRKTLTLAGGLLVAFHVWLLASQAWGGELIDVGLLARWLLAGALVAALWRLRQQGEPLFLGRKAVAIWLLAALLHAPAVADRLGVDGIPALPEVAATLVQSTVNVGAIAGLVLLLALLAGARTRELARRWIGRPGRTFLAARSLDSHFDFLPRPPPLV